MESIWTVRGQKSTGGLQQQGSQPSKRKRSSMDEHACNIMLIMKVLIKLQAEETESI